MHETAVVEGLMRILRDHARQNGVERILSVRLKVGRLRGLDVRQLRGCFEIFAEGTVADGARLDIDEVQVRARCAKCGCEYDVPRYRFDCPDCGSPDADVLAGRELYIESFEAARPEA
jgi:hydrogenase nickel incorporation protein HypA/HybF